MKRCLVRFLSKTLTSKPLAENWRQYDVKNDVKASKSSSRCHTRESSYTPHVRRHSLAPVGFTEIPVRYARIGNLQSYITDKFLQHVHGQQECYQLVINGCLETVDTENLFIFKAINCHVLPMQCQVMVINFHVSLGCLISSNGCIKFSWRSIFAKISALQISRKSIAHEIKQVYSIL